MQANEFTIRAGLNGGPGIQTNSENAFWILVTFPYFVADSFDRGRLDSPTQDGFLVVSRDDDEASSGQVTPLLFDSEIRSWSLSQSKSSYVHTLNLEMINGDNSLTLLEWLGAGDWCLFWTFANREDFERVRRRLVTNHRCKPWTPDNGAESKTSDRDFTVNDWNSGLKFVGRLQAPRHHEARGPGGEFMTGYSLSAAAFTEFGSITYYDDVIRFKYPNAVQFYQDLGLSIEKFLAADGPNQGFIDTNAAVPGLVKILLGDGPGELSKNVNGTDLDGRAKLADSPNIQFEVPPEVLQMFFGPGTTAKNYADLLLQFIGDQTYGRPQAFDDFRFLVPEVDRVENETVVFTKRPIIDYYPPDPADFKNISVWSIISHYANLPINEVYTALRPHPKSGNLLPSLVMRRNPYSSDTYQSRNDALRAMPFSAVPRWIVPSALVRESSIGREEGVRFNYVHVTPSCTISSDQATNQRLNRLVAPPVVDRISVKRHGLRLFTTSVSGFAVPGAETEESSSARHYTSFMADIVMDAHLRYNGTVTTVGLQEPIQPGDNLVLNGVLFHIEAVSHSGSIQSGGEKVFDTQISLSHGIPLTVLAAQQRDVQRNLSQEPRAKKQDPVAISKASAKQTKAQAAKAQEDDEKKLRDERAKYREPPEDAIRELRNKRVELAATGLIGTVTGNEKT